MPTQIRDNPVLDENIKRGYPLVLHSDNGSPMKGATMLAALEKLGVLKSFSRTSVSDYNPYSESLFKTLKYHSTFPRHNKFADIRAARCWTEKFVVWYNIEYMNSGLKFVTPQQRHTGEDRFILQKRHNIYLLAKQKHPERWSGYTRNWKLPSFVILNPDKKYRQTKEIELMTAA